MTSSSRRPSVRLALAEAVSMRLEQQQPTSPSSMVKQEASSTPARATATTNGDDGDGSDSFFVAPVAVAIDRTGGHAAMREDILLPLDVSDDAAARLALKLCQETGMAASSAEAIKEQVLEYLAPFREAGARGEEQGAARPSAPAGGSVVPSPPRPRFFPAPRFVELELEAHCDGVRVRDRLLWDLSDPVPLPAAWAVETAKDLGLSAEGCRALRHELEATVRAARKRSKEGGAGEAIKGDPDASSWLPRVAEDKGGWGDA